MRAAHLNHARSAPHACAQRTPFMCAAQAIHARSASYLCAQRVPLHCARSSVLPHPVCAGHLTYIKGTCSYTWNTADFQGKLGSSATARRYRKPRAARAGSHALRAQRAALRVTLWQIHIFDHNCFSFDNAHTVPPKKQYRTHALDLMSKVLKLLDATKSNCADTRVHLGIVLLRRFRS